MKRRVYLYATALALSLAALAVNTVQVHGLENELQRIADTKIAEFKAVEPEDSLAQLNLGASVVATKAYVLVVDVSGQVSVFLQRIIDGESHVDVVHLFLSQVSAG